MELPFNTTISSDTLKGTGRFSEHVADWPTKRRWVEEAFEAFEARGYHVRSAYTAVKDAQKTKFVYTDRLWQGADMVGLGVASFGHMSGVHMQNLDTWEAYAAAVRNGQVPLSRAYRPTADERLIREVILQLKRGSIAPGYFQEKYGVDIGTRFKSQFDSLADEGYIAARTGQIVSLTRDGLLRVDALLKRFFLPQHLKVRYT
jgi:oxygen-independent coproporphyrinogen-3 oxidase